MLTKRRDMSLMKAWVLTYSAKAFEPGSTTVLLYVVVIGLTGPPDPPAAVQQGCGACGSAPSASRVPGPSWFLPTWGRKSMTPAGESAS